MGSFEEMLSFFITRNVYSSHDFLPWVISSFFLVSASFLKKYNHRMYKLLMLIILPINFPSLHLVFNISYVSIQRKNLSVAWFLVHFFLFPDRAMVNVLFERCISLASVFYYAR